MLSVEAVDLYYGASHTLRQVSLTAKKGEVTCVLGRNGVGKTSLLRAIFGLNPIRSGRIRWEDRDLTPLATHERARAGLALVPQGREIFPRLSVLENLTTGFATLPRSLRHLPDEIFILFPVLRDMLNRRGGDLSGGQQQQLAIARALVARPRLLILAGPHAYKLKRAVKYPYLDFSTAARRRAACTAELRLNRRTAPQLYLEVRAISRAADGSIVWGRPGGDRQGDPEGDPRGPIDFVVVMRRFDQQELLENVALAGGLSASLGYALTAHIV